VGRPADEERVGADGLLVHLGVEGVAGKPGEVLDVRQGDLAGATVTESPVRNPANGFWNGWTQSSPRDAPVSQRLPMAANWPGDAWTAVRCVCCRQTGRTGFHSPLAHQAMSDSGSGMGAAGRWQLTYEGPGRRGLLAPTAGIGGDQDQKRGSRTSQRSEPRMRPGRPWRTRWNGPTAGRSLGACGRTAENRGRGHDTEG